MRMPRRLTLTTLAPPVLPALAALALYLPTMSRAVSFIDSGELATVICTLGIAHPTGYPLFTMLGWLWVHLPLPGEEIIRLNLMCAVFAAAGVAVFVAAARLVIEQADTRAAGKERGKEENALVVVAAAGGGLLLAFSETYWSVATAVEVYALHVLFVALVLAAFLRAAYRPGKGSWENFAFVVGLGFTNHMTMILLAPGLLYLYFATQGFRREAWKRIGRMSLPFLLGLSPYLYLPLRAARGPLMNWGNPDTPERFLWHVSAKQFRVWIFSSTEVAGRQFHYFLSTLPGEMSLIGLALGAVGLVTLLVRARKLAVATLLLFVGTVAYSINYDIHDIDSYFLLAYVTLALWGAVGLHTILAYVSRSFAWNLRGVAVAGLLVAVLPAVWIYSREDEHHDFLVEDYTHNVFSSAERNALVLSYQWDYWVSAAYYYQAVRHERSDLAVVDKELLRRSWYYHQLESRYPWLTRASAQEIDAFKAQLYRFEHELPYDPAAIQGRFVEMIRSFIRRSMAERPVYVGGEIEPEFTAGLQRVPDGLLFRLYADSLFHPTPLRDFPMRPFERRGRLEDVMKTLYAQAFVARARYYVAAGQVGEARIAAHKALQYDPGFQEARRALTMLGE
jgi:hypothetical protein